MSSRPLEPALTGLPQPVLTVMNDIKKVQCLDVADGYDYLAVLASADPQYCWLLFAGTESQSHTVRYLRLPEWIASDSNWLDAPAESLSWFSQWSGSAVSGSPTSKRLIVKVEEQQLWFLRVPLTLFARNNLGSFCRYESVSWIVTDRSFSEALENRADLVRILASAPALVDATVVIINTYEHHQMATDALLIRNGIEAVKRILLGLQSIPFADRSRSLRWYENPGPKQLREILLDTRTKIVFGAFEAGGGRWEMGQAPTTEAPAPSLPFTLSDLRDQLSHILLMRIYHCYSIFDPYVAATVGGTPAGKDTLVRELLETGIQFVEGAMMEQSYMEFLAAVIDFLFRGSLRFVIDNRIREGLISGQLLTQTLNEILSLQGYDALQ